MRLGAYRPTPVVFGTLVLWVLVYIITAILARTDFGKAVYALLWLDPRALIPSLRLWTLVSHALVHSLDSPGHLVFNSIAFFFFGPALEGRWGARRFIVFMLLCALSGAAFVMLTHLLGLGSSPVVGGSCITMGLLIAWGFTFPDRELYFFFMLPVKGIHLIYLTLGFEVLNALSFSSVSAAGHFGGMFIGFLYGESSPARRLYLKLKLRRLQKQASKLKDSGGRGASGRGGGPSLRVIEGGNKNPPKDKRHLN